MKVVGLKGAEKYLNRHVDVRKQFDAWLCEVEEANWQTPNDIKERYPNASILAEKLVVFNLKGNKYRLAAKVDFKSQVLLIKKIGTHAEYSKWNLTGG